MSSSLTDPFSTPEGYHRLALANDNDHTAYIAIVTTLGLLYGLLFGAFRWFVRSTICPGVGIDDYLTGIATVRSLPILETWQLISLGTSSDSSMRCSRSLLDWLGEVPRDHFDR